MYPLTYRDKPKLDRFQKGIYMYGMFEILFLSYFILK